MYTLNESEKAALRHSVYGLWKKHGGDPVLILDELVSTGMKQATAKHGLGVSPMVIMAVISAALQLLILWLRNKQRHGVEPTDAFDVRDDEVLEGVRGQFVDDLKP